MKLPTTPQVSYLAALPIIQRVAKEHGYTIAVHGSLARDLDVIAVPWLEEAAEPHALVLALIDALEGFVSPEDPEVPLRLPHGRLCYPIHLGSGRYVDLSIMPRTAGVEAAPEPNSPAVQKAMARFYRKRMELLLS
jgi:hypothetical protein